MTPTKQQPPKKSKVITQKYPVIVRPTEKGWGKSETNKEKSDYKDWFGKKPS